jgi:hypothetical protein
MLLNAVTPFII